MTERKKVGPESEHSQEDLNNGLRAYNDHSAAEVVQALRHLTGKRTSKVLPPRTEESENA